MTGSDGTATLNVTRPDTHGTKVTLTAALYSDPTKTAALDTIFTVVTSPDTAKARMWGHMPETLTAGGITFKRPVVKAELGNIKNRSFQASDNESGRYSTGRRPPAPVLMIKAAARIISR